MAVNRPNGTAGRRDIEAQYRLLGMMLIAPTVLIFCAVIVYPLISAVYLSLFSIYTPTLKGDFVGLSNFSRMLGSSRTR